MKLNWNFNKTDCISPCCQSPFPATGHWALGSLRGYMPRATEQGVLEAWEPQHNSFLELCFQEGGRGPASPSTTCEPELCQACCSVSLIGTPQHHSAVGMISPFCRWQNCNSVRLNNMPKTTELKSGRAQLQPRSLGPASPGFYHTPWHLTSVFGRELMRNKKQWSTVFLFMDRWSLLGTSGLAQPEWYSPSVPNPSAHLQTHLSSWETPPSCLI